MSNQLSRREHQMTVISIVSLIYKKHIKYNIYISTKFSTDTGNTIIMLVGASQSSYKILLFHIDIISYAFLPVMKNSLHVAVVNVSCHTHCFFTTIETSNTPKFFSINIQQTLMHVDGYHFSTQKNSILHLSIIHTFM